MMAKIKQKNELCFVIYTKKVSTFAAQDIGVWCSWLAFLHGVQAVARSSRATPTKSFKTRLFFFCLCFVSFPVTWLIKKGTGLRENPYHKKP